MRALRRLLLVVGTISLLIHPFPVASLTVDTPGSISAWGYNGLYCLGDGTTTSSSSPVVVELPPGVTASAIAAGGFHNLANTTDGVYTWGGGDDPTPVRVALPPQVTAVTGIAAGQYHSMALTDDGLYAWGGNGSGQLGDGTNTDSTVPVKVLFPPPVTTVVAVAAGSYHSMALTDDGVYAWGSNGSGQLGDATHLDRTRPVKVAFASPVTVLAIAGGGFHSLALTGDGAYAWGNNTFGQLGDGTTTGRAEPTRVLFPNVPPMSVTAIAAGFWHSLAVGDGSIYGWGYNGNGELGVRTSSARTVPVKAVFGKKTAVRVTAIAAGGMHSLAVSDTGDVYAFGNNSSGQLGMQGGTRYAPARVSAERHVVSIGAGYYHSLALH